MNTRKTGDLPAREISTDSPLKYGAFTLHQTGFQKLPGVDLSIMRVTSDPGRLLKYAGCAMICGGILGMFCVRVFARRPAPRPE
jgi:hypothetical protein